MWPVLVTVPCALKMTVGRGVSSSRLIDGALQVMAEPSDFPSTARLEEQSALRLSLLAPAGRPPKGGGQGTAKTRPGVGVMAPLFLKEDLDMSQFAPDK